MKLMHSADVTFEVRRRNQFNRLQMHSFSFLAVLHCDPGALAYCLGVLLEGVHFHVRAHDTRLGDCREAMTCYLPGSSNGSSALATCMGVPKVAVHWLLTWEFIRQHCTCYLLGSSQGSSALAIYLGDASKGSVACSGSRVLAVRQMQHFLPRTRTEHSEWSCATPALAPALLQIKTKKIF